MFQEEPRAVAGADEWGRDEGIGIRKKQDKGELVMDSFVNTLDR